MATDEEFIASIARRVNSHGYGLPYALTREVNRLFVGRTWGWHCWPQEFPVEFRSRDSRIDLILEHLPRDRPSSTRLFLTIECKRVNPAFSKWCFLRSNSGSDETELQDQFVVHVLQDLEKGGPGRGLRIALKSLGNQSPVFHLGLPIKSKQQGDPSSGSDRDAIEAACFQALNGASGLIELFRNENDLRTSLFTGIVPVVFTTAELWTLHDDLGTANLVDGNMNLASTVPRKVDWLLLHFPASRSSSLSGEIWDSNETRSGDLSQYHYRRNVRSIAIVTALGLESFLKANLWHTSRSWDWK